jgi:hypothetical protein
LGKAVDLTAKLFAGAHQSKVDVDTAARVIGYASSTGGAAASAIGALRQYGLVDGLRGEVAVSDLAMRILQPMNELERFEALEEAAKKPDIFERLIAHFEGKLPASNEPIKAYLIRNEGFSAGGADDLIEALRSTIDSLPTQVSSQPEGNPIADDGRNAYDVTSTTETPRASGPPPSTSAADELVVLPLASNCRAELRFVGEVTTHSYERLIKHLQLLQDMLADEGDRSR